MSGRTLQCLGLCADKPGMVTIICKDQEYIFLFVILSSSVLRHNGLCSFDYSHLSSALTNPGFKDLFFKQMFAFHVRPLSLTALWQMRCRHKPALSELQWVHSCIGKPKYEATKLKSIKKESRIQSATSGANGRTGVIKTSYLETKLSLQCIWIKPNITMKTDGLFLFFDAAI